MSRGGSTTAWLQARSTYPPSAPAAGSAWDASARLTREVGAMPDANDPDRVVLHPVEEAARRDDDFAMRELRELRNLSPGLWKLLESSEHGFGTPSEPRGRRRFVAADVRHCVQELRPRRWCETDPQSHSVASMA